MAYQPSYLCDSSPPNQLAGGLYGFLGVSSSSTSWLNSPAGGRTQCSKHCQQLWALCCFSPLGDQVDNSSLVFLAQGHDDNNNNNNSSLSGTSLCIFFRPLSLTMMDTGRQNRILWNDTQLYGQPACRTYQNKKSSNVKINFLMDLALVSQSDTSPAPVCNFASVNNFKKWVLCTSMRENITEIADEWSCNR